MRTAAIGTALACLGLVAGCDASVTLVTPRPSTTTVAAATPDSTPSSTATSEPTELPTLEAMPEPVMTDAPAPAVSATPEATGPQALESAGNEMQVDANGDGALNAVRFDPAHTDGSGYVMITIDGVDYATFVPGGGEFSFYPVDLLPGDGRTEFLIMRQDGTTSELYLCRLTDGMMQQGTFTYLLPAEISPSSTDEAHYMEPCLVFSGVEPIVNLRDGSFAVLAIGQGFQRYVVDESFNVTEGELLPLTLLTNGGAELLHSSTPAPAEGMDPAAQEAGIEIADPSVEDSAWQADPNAYPVPQG